MSELIRPEIIGNNTVVIHLSGEVDVNLLPDLESVTKPFIENQAITAFVLDCQHLEFIDSKIVGYIAYLRTTLTKGQRSLSIAAMNETINDILSLVGLNQIIPNFESPEQAMTNKTS